MNDFRPMTIQRAIEEDQQAHPVVDAGGTGKAAVHLVAIGLTGWTLTPETAPAWADGWNAHHRARKTIDGKPGFRVSENVLVFAFRYALGRQTYAPIEIADALVEHAHRLKPHTRAQIAKEIREEFAAWTRLKLDRDRATWNRVLDAFEKVPNA